MMEITYKADKKGVNRSYRYSRSQMRWFPISRKEADEAILSGKATIIRLAETVVQPGTPRGW